MLTFEVLVIAEGEVFGRRFLKSRALGAVKDIFGVLYVRHGCVLLEHSRSGRFVVGAARLRIPFYLVFCYQLERGVRVETGGGLERGSPVGCEDNSDAGVDSECVQHLRFNFSST